MVHSRDASGTGSSSTEPQGLSEPRPQQFHERVAARILQRLQATESVSLLFRASARKSAITMGTNARVSVALESRDTVNISAPKATKSLQQVPAFPDIAKPSQ